LLTGGESLRQRGGSGGGDSAHDVEQRIDDWQGLASSVGIGRDRVIELDLDHLTQQSQARLAQWLDGGENVARAGQSRRIESAFEMIADQAQRWHSTQGEISAKEQAELHKKIAGLYRDEQWSWRKLIDLPDAGVALLPANLGSSIKSSAQRIADLLPERLRLSPRWLAAGAAAGALGCVAAASLISPVAIGALPVWSGIGAAIAAVVRPSNGTVEEVGATDAKANVGEAVRAAALFAVLLELQGQEERVITRVLDQVIVDEGDDQLIVGGRSRSGERDVSDSDAEPVRRWLEEMRHRLDMALSREAGR
jgi:hypothetical protein